MYPACITICFMFYLATDKDKCMKLKLTREVNTRLLNKMGLRHEDSRMSSLRRGHSKTRFLKKRKKKRRKKLTYQSTPPPTQTANRV